MLESMEKMKLGKEVPPPSPPMEEKPKVVDLSSLSCFTYLDFHFKNVIKNFVILPNRKQEIINQVFRPGWNLPSWTVEEWGEYEYRMMKERESQEKK